MLADSMPGAESFQRLADAVDAITAKAAAGTPITSADAGKAHVALRAHQSERDGLVELVGATKAFVVARRAQAMGGADPDSQVALWGALMEARARFDRACKASFGVEPWYGMPDTPPDPRS